MADWRGIVVVRETIAYGRTGFDSGLLMSFFLLEKLSVTVQKFSKCLKNGNDRLRKGKFHRRKLQTMQFENL